MNDLLIRLNGEIQSSNFHEWKNELIGQIHSTQLDLLTDHDFADAELNVKTFKVAEKTLKNAKKVAIEQASDIQELFDAIKIYVLFRPLNTTQQHLYSFPLYPSLNLKQNIL